MLGNHSTVSTAMDSFFASATPLSIGLNHSASWLPVLFRTMAFLIALPIIFLASLDVAAYLIARTLGAPHHRHIKAAGLHTTVSASSSTGGLALQQQPTIIVSPPCIEPCTLTNALSNLPAEGYHHTHFSSSSDANFALAGEGVFSPPESRSSSPPLHRTQYKTRARSTSIGVEALGTITDDDSSEGSSTTSSFSDLGSAASSPASTIRRRNHPGLQFTPMKA